MGDGGGFGGNGFWFTAAIVLLVIVRFLARELRVRRVPLNRFFAVPIVLCVLALVLIYFAVTTAPGSILELVIGSIAAIAVGSVLGLAIDRYTTISLTDDGQRALIRGSWTTVAIWLAALLLRLVGRWVVLHAAGTVTIGMTMVLNATLLILLAAATLVLRLRLFGRARAIASAQRSAATA